MSYTIIQPHSDFNFRQKTQKELKEYNKWYHSVEPERIHVVTHAIVEDLKIEPAHLQFDPASLLAVGKWFAKSVEVRARTDEEINRFKENLKFPVDFPKYELTDRTFSIAIDIGMYVSRVFRREFPDLGWVQAGGGKTSVDYGQPVLSPFGGRVFNPTRMMVVQAYGLANQKGTGGELAELFDIWSNLKRSGSNPPFN